MSDPSVPGEVRAGFWRRRIRDPLVSLLAQGLSPEKLALSLAVGAVLGLFPLLGTTTVLCLLAGAVFRLNHVGLQLGNHLAYPVQIPLILAFVRLGEGLLRAPRVTFDPLALVGLFQQDPAGFLREFSLTGLHGILGWALVAPAVLVGLYVALRPPLRRLDAALRRRSPAATA